MYENLNDYLFSRVGSRLQKVCCSWLFRKVILDRLIIARLYVYEYMIMIVTMGIDVKCLTVE